MAKVAFGEIDVLAYAKDNSRRTGISKMGGYPQRWVGRAVRWKGAKGSDLRRLSEVAPRVAAGLNNARALSAAHREQGVCIVDRVRTRKGSKLTKGGTTIVPTKVGMMMQDAGTGAIRQTFDSVDEAIAARGIVAGSTIRA